ncbi:hypothetical protein D3C72_825520 [compost metagenome]
MAAAAQETHARQAQPRFLAQEYRVARALDVGRAIGPNHVGEIVHPALRQPQQGLPVCRGQRRGIEKMGNGVSGRLAARVPGIDPVCERVAREPLVAAEVLGVEKHRAAQAPALIGVSLARWRRGADVDAHPGQHRTHGRTVGGGWRHLGAAAVAHQRLAAHREFVALGVAAEVVVVVEDQDAPVRAKLLAIEPRRGQPADAAAHHHEVIRFARQHGRVRSAFARQAVGQRERAGVVAAQPGQRRRVAGRCGLGPCLTNQPRRGNTGRNAQRGAIEEVSTGDRHGRQRDGGRTGSGVGVPSSRRRAATAASVTGAARLPQLPRMNVSRLASSWSSMVQP